MKSLREEAEKRINEKMEGIDTARTDALDAIAAEVEVSFFHFFPDDSTYISSARISRL